MKNKKKLLLTLALSLLIFVFVYLISNQNEGDLVIVKSKASWAKDYPTLNSIIEDADLIVKGNVVSEKSYKEDERHVVTEANFKPTKVFLNKTEVNVDTIPIMQAGGTADGLKEIPPEPTELLKKEHTYILFLEYFPEWQKFAVVGQFPGQFKLDNGVAKNLDYENRYLSLPITELEEKLKPRI